MALVDYYAIQEDMQTLLLAGPAAGYTTAPKEVFIEGMERDMVFGNMPFINIRLIEAELEPRSMPNGYNIDITYEVDISAFDFTLFKKAATVRDDLLGEAQKAIHENSRFNGDILDSLVAPEVRFGALIEEGAGGHVAIGTFTVTVRAYVDTT